MSKTLVNDMMELKRRRMDGLKMIRLTDHQAEIMRDPATEMLIAGGNRGSKTLCAATRFASIARDIPVQTMSGELIECRRSHQKDRPLIMWVFGDHLKHIGQVIYRTLFRAGLYWIIRDRNTKAWRAWNPVQFPEDWDRKEERKPAPPLIPQSEIKDTAWHHKSIHQFEKVTLHNGTEIFAYASSGDDPQGTPADIVWIDEHLVRHTTYAELLNRLSDKEGDIQWSTIPRMTCTAYRSVVDRAAQQEEEVAEGKRKPEDVFTRHYALSTLDNPFIPESEKVKRKEQLNERDVLVRLYGVGSTELIRIYQEFNENVHTADYGNDNLNDDMVEVLRSNNWTPPMDWTNELILDPGTQRPGVLLGSVPPEKFWHDGEPTFVVWGELYEPRLDAYGIAERLSQRLKGLLFNRFIIDGQAARQKPMGFSWTIGEQYQRAFEKYNLTCTQTGSLFVPGDPSFIQSSGCVHTAMRMRQSGYPQLRIVKHLCRKLIKQIETNVRKTDRDGEPLEEEGNNRENDLRKCLEYWLSRHPRHVEQPRTGLADPPGVRRWKASRAERMARKEKQPGGKSTGINIGMSAGV